MYGWDGSDLILIPISSPDFVEIKKLNDLRHNPTSLLGKNLIIGATYKSNDNTNLVYLGRFYEANGDNKETKTYFFYDIDSKSTYRKIRHYKSLTGNILDIVDEKCTDNYSILKDELTKSNYYSERDPKRDVYDSYTLDEFISGFESTYYGESFYTDEHEKCYISKHRNHSWSRNSSVRYDVYDSHRNRKNEKILENATLEAIFQKYKPKYLVTYKTNGELIKKWRKINAKQQ
ncbi:hypothetical protein [Brevibacillus porteri]|uniref:hypothetical protein n=1 Tax=Brevibacillus porteri TaxID=2126350 RepID=UPI00363BB57F